MGQLYLRTCSHCKFLFEAISQGVCEKTHHRVSKIGDDEKAKTCELYENKYGYDEDGNDINA